MSDYLYKIETFLKKDLFKIKNPQIVEFGRVREGRSTKLFLDLCDQNDGKLFQWTLMIIQTYLKTKNWKFIKSRDDNFNFLEDILPKKLDIVYLDSLHEADHVEKIFYHYFSKLKINGYFFIDDISWIPYLKTEKKEIIYCEINNSETFERILSIYLSNQKILI